MPEEADTIQKDDYTNEKFDFDASGRPLRYKILVHNMKIWAVLYNTGNSIEILKFQEIRISNGPEDYIQIEGEDPLDFQFGKVTQIPLAMLSTTNKQHIESLAQGTVSNDLSIHCMSRNFEKLPGYVDVDILSSDSLTSVNMSPVKIAVAICRLTPAPQDYYQTFKMIAQSSKDAILVEIQGMIAKFEAEVKEGPSSKDLETL